MTNQPHREFIYRMAFELGRHIIGYEVQKVLSLVDWMSLAETAPIGVIGYGEGGLIALYSAGGRYTDSGGKLSADISNRDRRSGANRSIEMSGDSYTNLAMLKSRVLSRRVH